jgi:hypothetical protein
VARQQIIDVGKGLFLVRYASANDRANPPSVSIAPAPGSERAITTILHPDARDATLWQPGTGLVFRSTAPGQLAVNVMPAGPRGSVAASVEIETLTQGVPPVPAKLTQQRPSNQITFTDDLVGNEDDDEEEEGVQASVLPPLPTSGGGEVRVLGHVAGRGDVTAGPDEWLAGPSAPSRIEGIAIEWPSCPPGAKLRYAVTYGTRNPASSGLKDLGTFVGSRGKAMPITGIALELVGATGQQIVAEALFLGSPLSRSKGPKVQLSGPTRQEPLVGLRLSLTEAAEAKPPRQNPAVRPVAAVEAAPRSTGRVRVFRGKAGAG